MPKFIKLDEAAALIRDGDTVGVGGFCGFGAPDSVLRAVGARYGETGSPKAITVITPAAAGNGTDEPWGLAAIGADGLVDTLITSVLMLPKNILEAVNRNKIACYCPPLGYFGHMFRALAGKDPGVITHVGRNTYCDPRLEGCKMNERAKQGRDIVRVIPLDGEDYLFYPVIKMDVCILRGTYADEDGNISAEHEAVHTEMLEMVNAVHNNGGTVIFQVEKVVKRNTLDPRTIVVHKSAVDYIVLSAPGEHLQSYAIPEYRPELVGEIRVPSAQVEPIPMDLRKVIARRAAMEIKKGSLVNLGLGISEGISMVAAEEGVTDEFTLSIETGILGGTTLSGGAVGAGINADAFYKMPDTFDLYNGGGLDQCFLSAAEIDEEGNVNVSKFNGRVNGGGGFVNITQNTKEVFFSCIFTAGHPETELLDGEIHILRDSSRLKFVKKVEQISFSGKEAACTGKKITFITERGVFRLTPEGLELFEIAPGVDLDRDILEKMEFVPKISPDLKQMDSRIFRPQKLGLVLRERNW